MKIILSTAFFALLSTSLTAVAAKEVSNKGQAFGACKAAAHERLDNVQGVKMLSVRHHKKKYKVKIRVTRASERSKLMCTVARDGNVAFSDQ